MLLYIMSCVLKHHQFNYAMPRGVGNSGRGCGLGCSGQRKQGDTRIEDTNQANVTVVGVGEGDVLGSCMEFF